MRAALGLPSPEEKIGYAAHDFTSFLGAERVYLTRAQKIDGVPTVPSRWLMRLQALLSGLGLARSLRPQQSWLGWARARDRIGPRIRISAPEPRPPLDLRPRKMSVTRIETWLSNPYAIFAGSILRLEKLPSLGVDPDAALGLHRARDHEPVRRSLARPRCRPTRRANLLTIARDVLGHYGDNPRVAAFWLPRFLRFAQWFAETEPARRRGVVHVVAEVAGSLTLAGPGGSFTLTARADRIDVGDSGIVITDYKTGTPPTDNRIKQGLRAAAPARGGDRARRSRLRRHCGSARDRAALHQSLRRRTGGRGTHRGGRRYRCPRRHGARATWRNSSRSFDDERTPYKALRRSDFAQLYKFDDYAHLARVAEWGVAEEEDVLP